MPTFSRTSAAVIYAIRARQPGAPVRFATGIEQPVDLLAHDSSLFYLARGSGEVLRIDYQP